MPAPTTALPTRPYRPRSAGHDWAIRLGRCLLGFALFGAGVDLLLEAHLGAAPWDVFHQGVADHLDLPIGRVIVATGLLLLLVWIPLRQRPGVGTILNAVEIGVTVDVVAMLIPRPGPLVLRLGYVVLGLVVVAIGSGLYIGSGLGAGPRDGIMMGLRDRGISVRVARTAIEVVVLVAGLALGGTVGVGTIAFTFGIGPLVQVVLPRFLLPPRRSIHAAPHTSP